MIYIVTEDQNSARDFWRIVADTFLGSDNYVLEPLPVGGGGNTRLQEQITNVFTKIKSGDSLFIAFDNIANTKNFVPSDFISKTSARCTKVGVNFQYTTYYCFEEIYLSYEEFVKLSCNYKDIDVVKVVNQCINNAKDYYRDQIVESFMKRNCDINLSNREQFLNYLLVESSKMIYGCFQITKSGKCFDKNAECWVKDCVQIQERMTEQHYRNLCNQQCQYCCKGKLSKNKLIDLKEKSIFARCGGNQLCQFTE